MAICPYGLYRMRKYAMGVKVINYLQVYLQAIGVHPRTRGYLPINLRQGMQITFDITDHHITA